MPEAKQIFALAKTVSGWDICTLLPLPLLLLFFPPFASFRLPSLLFASLRYFIINRLKFFLIFFVCLSSCFMCFLFCVFCVCVFFLLLYTAVSFQSFLKVYRPLLPGGNPIAVNKYHIISKNVSTHTHTHTHTAQMYHKLSILTRFTMRPCHLLPPVLRC